MRGVGTDTENQIGGSLKGIESFVEKITNAFQRMRAWAEPYVEAFAAIDDEMVGVMKYTGLARTEVEQLDQALLQINTRTTHEQLLQLAQDAGRLGIQSKEDILAFVRAADTINLALGEDLGEDAIRNIAKLAQIFGDAEQLGLERAMLATASTINELAQSSTAAEPYLAEFASRLGSIGATAGLTQAQILAYASVMDQSGINVERAATALQNVIMRLYQDPAKAAEVAGLEVKAFTDLIRTDANEALLQWAQAMGNMKGGLSDTAPALKSLHMAGSGVSEMIMNLANNTTLLRTTQQQATAAFQQATSATNEAAAAQSSAAARLEILKNRISQAREEIGQRLAPAFIASTGTLLLFTRALAAIISVALSPWFIGATAAIAAYTVAVNASIIADQLKALWTNNVRTALVKLYATAKAHPWGIVLAAIGALIGYLISLREKTEEITEAQRALARAQEQAEQSAAAETSRLRRLYEATQDQTLAMEQRIAAAEALQRQYPDYFGKLNTEAILAGKAADAYADLTQQIIAAARARAMESEIEELEKKNLQLRRERQEAQRRYETARQASDNAYAGGTGAGGVGGAAFAGAAAGISADRYLQTVNSIDRQIEANNQAINTLAKSVNNLQTTVNRATNAAHAATSAITASYSGTSGKSRKSGNTTHTPPKETPQQAANRERQERLQLAQKQLQRTDLTNEVRTILQAIVKQIQEDIRLNPNAPIGKPRTPRTSGNSRKSGTSRTSAPTTTPAPPTSHEPPSPPSKNSQQPSQPQKPSDYQPPQPRHSHKTSQHSTPTSPKASYPPQPTHKHSSNSTSKPENKPHSKTSKKNSTTSTAPSNKASSPTNKPSSCSAKPNANAKNKCANSHPSPKLNCHKTPTPTPSATSTTNSTPDDKPSKKSNDSNSKASSPTKKPKNAAPKSAHKKTNTSSQQPTKPTNSSQASHSNTPPTSTHSATPKCSASHKPTTHNSPKPKKEPKPTAHSKKKNKPPSPPSKTNTTAAHKPSNSHKHSPASHSQPSTPTHQPSKYPSSAPSSHPSQQQQPSQLECYK